MVPKENVEKWLKYLRNDYPTVAFKATTQEQRKHLNQSGISTDLASKSLLQSSECLGADILIQLLKNYCRNLNLKTSISVGIIGYPNVGKSSLINSLKRVKAVGVGATPGFTKTLQVCTENYIANLFHHLGSLFRQECKVDRLSWYSICIRQ